MAEAAREGLHVHLVPCGESYRFALWVERYEETGSLSTFKKPALFPPPHPGCVRSGKALRWLSDGLPAAELTVLSPRLGNGRPVPLPGLMAGWDLSSFRAGGRTMEKSPFSVTGFLVPPALSLAPLRALLAAWTERRGRGFLAPQAFAVMELVDALGSLLREGPLLPTSLASPDPRTPTHLVPPVSLAQLHDLLDLARGAPFLAAVTAICIRPDDVRSKSCLDERFPRRWARFVSEILDAAAVRGLAAGRPRLKKAAGLSPGEIGRLHAAHGSCLHPDHPIFRAPDVSPAHLHGRLVPAPPGAPPERAWRLELGLRPDPASEAWISLSRLRDEGLLFDGAVEQQGNVWFRPASVLHRDLSLMAGRRPVVFARPDLLTGGGCTLSEDEARALLAEGDQRGPSWDMKTFRRLEGLPNPASGRGKDFLAFSLECEPGDPVRLTLRWDIAGLAGGTADTGDSAGAGATSGPVGGTAGPEGPLLSFRFIPTFLVTVGEHELLEEEAEQLLLGAGAGVIRFRDRTVDRGALVDALDLLRARKKVLDRLKQGGLTWDDVTRLDDEWAADEDEGRLRVEFAGRWERFLSGLGEGAGLPLLGTPPGFGGTLRPYQERGLSWMSALTEHGLGGCLADDMGLGKTVQVLALLWERRRRRSGASRREGRPDLVVCPTSVVLGWAAEARRFTPELRVHVHQGPERRRTSAGFEKAVAGSDVVVSSYALVNRDRALFEPVEWETLVVDEAHNLKNPRAQKTHALKALRAAARLALTGTPVENRLRDIWSIFNFVLPGLLGGPTRFARAFLAPLRQGDDRAFSRLSRRLGPFLLRRTKKEPGIADELPEKQEQDVFCELSREQAALYHAMVEATLAGLRDKKGIHRKAHVLAALTHLKQICNHPEAFAAEKPDHLFGRSGKLDRLAELLEELLAEEQAVLLFTQFVGTGELLARAIEQRFGVVAPFLHGGLLPAARAAIVVDFQAPAGSPVLIASLRAGGVGINLTRASAVIHYDRWWNPAVEDQATDRAHRIGQTQRVNVYKLVVRGTLEERILGMLEQKRALAARVLAGADESWLTELGDEELRELLTLGEPLEEGNAGGEEREEEQEEEEEGDGG